ncbi:MAG: DNA polymerase III subunit gamma/tau [Planctomycetota bacterium]|nr:MAG: DNA polymerase III subunit gamma/tau [Planctomycetota bacterium]
MLMRESMAKKSDRSSEAPPLAIEPAEHRPYTVLARRYRSREFDDLIGQEPISRTLKNAMLTGRTAHAYLFCGTRGVGKTSLARIFARALNAGTGGSEHVAVGEAILRGEDLDVTEIDGASNRGIDDARDLIAGAGLAPTRGKYRIYIIDEVHMLTTPAFNALLKTMEEPPSHVKFILCTTEPHKVPQTIQSRCQRFDFRNIPASEIARHLGAVATKEGMDASADALLAVARMANGSMRDGLSLLDRLFAASLDQRVDAALLEQVFGLPQDALLLDLVAAIVEERCADALKLGAQLLEGGTAVEHALDLLAERFRWLLVASACGGASELLECASASRERLTILAKHVDLAHCVHAIAACDAISRSVRSSSAPRALFDACLVRLALASRFASGAALLAGASQVSPPGVDAKKAVDPRVTNAGGRVPPVAAPSSSPLPQIAPSTVLPPSVEVARIDSKDALVESLAQHAVQSSADKSVVDEIAVLEFTRTRDGAKAIIDADPSTSQGRYVLDHPERVRTLLRKVLGGPVELDLRPRSGREAPRAVDKGVADAVAREDPLVKSVMELFDATIVEITARVAREDSLEASSASSDESVDQH